MEWIDNAIVLQIGKFKETDLWIRLLTQKHGIVTCFAFGASKSRRRFCGCLDILNQIKVKVSQKTAYFCLEEASLLTGPERLRYDSQRLGIVINCLRFLECYGVANEDSQNIFALVISLLDTLEDSVYIAGNLTMLFRYKIAVLNGYALALDKCQVCNLDLIKLDKIFYAVNEGIIVCQNCMPRNTWIVRINQEVLQILTLVESTLVEDWFMPNILNESLRQSSQLIDALIAYHLGIEWHNSYFRRI